MNNKNPENEISFDIIEIFGFLVPIILVIVTLFAVSLNKSESNKKKSAEKEISGIQRNSDIKS